MNDKAFGESSASISQIRKDRIDEIVLLSKLSIYVSNFDDNDITAIIKGYHKIDLDDPRLVRKEPPIISLPKRKPEDIPRNYAQETLNTIEKLVDLSCKLVLLCGERVIVPTECVAVNNIEVKIKGYEKESEVVLTVPYNEIVIIILDKKIVDKE